MDRFGIIFQFLSKCCLINVHPIVTIRIQSRSRPPPSALKWEALRLIHYRCVGDHVQYGNKVETQYIQYTAAALKQASELTNTTVIRSSLWRT